MCPESTGAEIDELKKDVDKLEKRVEVLDTQLGQVLSEQIEYLQNISHQLVAPLNAIKWHIENLTAGRMTPVRAQKVLRSIYSQATIAVHLAKNFVLMSNLEADHSLKSLREPLEIVDLKKLLINLADDFQPLGWDKGINIYVNDESFRKQSEVMVIKSLISQVFSNIIENAIKYSNTDSNIWISRIDHKNTKLITIQVSNNGIGIPEEDINKIFGRSFRSHRAINRHPAGTGFGLYIAERIINIHNGKIEATSKPSGETFFKVSFPAK